MESAAPHRLAPSHHSVKKARAFWIPSKSYRRREIVIVSVHFVRRRKIHRIIVREGRHAEGIHRRAEILVAQAQVQRQVLRRLPGILEKITLPEEIGVVNRTAKLPVQAAPIAPKII